MSMTPLQAIAATKFVEGEGISAHRMQSIADAYTAHPVVTLLRSRSDIQDAVDAIFPAASGGVRAADVTFFGTFGAATDIEVAIVQYANYVLCGGDLGKFSSVVDKCSGLITAIGDVTATIDKAATMKFSDFGPGVANYGDAINMGLGPATAGIAEAMKAANNGQLPVVAGTSTTESASVGTVILSQGEVSGDSGSPNYGTAIGIYEAAQAAGLVGSVEAIIESHLNVNSVPLQTYVSGTSRKTLVLRVGSNINEEAFNQLMDDTDAWADQYINDLDPDYSGDAKIIRDWVTEKRAKGAQDFIAQVRKIQKNIMRNPGKYQGSGVLYVTAQITVFSEVHTAEAVNALSLEDAKKLFAGLKSKIQIEKLEKYTDVLDLAKCAAAMPEPLTTKNAPSAVTTAAADGAIATETSAVIAGTALVPKIQGTLPTLPSVPSVNIAIPDIRSLSTESASSLGAKALAAANGIKSSLIATTTSLTTTLKGVGSTASGLAITNIDAIKDFASSTMSSFGADMGKIKGFGNLPDTKSLGTLLRSVETSMPVLRGIPGLSSLTQPVTVTDADIEEARKLESNKADVAAGKPSSDWNVTPEQYVRNSKLNKALTPNLLNSFTDVMPPGIKTSLQAVVGTGTGAGGSYKLTDFVGSAVGENGQVTNWSSIIKSLDTIWSSYQSALESEVAQVISTSSLTGLTNLLTTLVSSQEGVTASTAYNTAISTIRNEYGLLINKAQIDFANIPANDLTGMLNLSKKLAQHASKLESGHAVIFQNAADPTTVGGQAMLGVMVEARNTKLLHKAGLSPVNAIAKATQAAVTDTDTQEAAKIQADSGDADAITPQQVANNRALNNTLGRIFGG
jgi:hypothetical protein